MLSALKDRGSQFPGRFLLQRDCPRGFCLVIALPPEGGFTGFDAQRANPRRSHILSTGLTFGQSGRRLWFGPTTLRFSHSNLWKARRANPALKDRVCALQ